MDKNKGIYITFFLILLLILGLGTYYLYSQGVLFNPKTEIEEEDEDDEKEEIIFRTEKGLVFDLTSPTPNSELGCDFILAGEMPREWFFENSFPYSITVNEKEILKGTVQGLADYTIEEMIPFSEKIICSEECKGEGEIILRNDNPSGLLENSDEYRIPVKFTSSCVTETMQVKVFYGSSIEDPDSLRCDVTYELPRTIEKTVAVGKASLLELLKGPNITERGKGYYSSIPIGTELNSLKVEDGVAYADFNQKLTENIGGACLNSKIRSQIEGTLKQFSTVDKVVISVNGETEGVLEP